MDCEICAQQSSGENVIYRDDRWSLWVRPGLEVPAWFVLSLRRHAEGLAELNDDEAETLGPLVRRISLAIREAIGVDKVYLVFFGEHFAHVHFGVITPPAGL